MSTYAAPRHPASTRRMRGAASFAVIAVLLVGWFAFLAPTQLGGPATFVVVDGHSMEPMLHTGDLAVAREQGEYQAGDLVVFAVKAGAGSTFIIHRLISGSAASGWQTQGDHNAWVDPWTTSNESIAGRYWFVVPGVGTALTWAAQHALLFGLICATLAALSYIPWRRRKVAPALATALDFAKKEPRRDGRTNSEYGVLAVAALGALVSLALVGMLGMSHQLATVRGLIGGASLLFTGGLTMYLLYRLYDGRGVQEPSKSMYALSGRLYRVDELPMLNEAVAPVRSAIELRSIAEKYRMPVLHRIDALTGIHEFLLITVQRGAFLWTAIPAAVPAVTPEILPVPVVVAAHAHDDVDFPEVAPLLHALAADADHSHTIEVLDHVPLVAMLAEYVDQGTAAGDSVMIVASREHHRMLAELSAGPYVILYTDEVLDLITVTDDTTHISTTLLDQVVGTQVRALAADGHVRIYGELVGALWEQGRVNEVLAVEGWWNELRHDIDFELFCGYGVTTIPLDPRIEKMHDEWHHDHNHSRSTIH